MPLGALETSAGASMAETGELASPKAALARAKPKQSDFIVFTVCLLICVSEAIETGSRRRRLVTRLGGWLLQRFVCAANVVIDANPDGVKGVVLDLRSGKPAPGKTKVHGIAFAEIQILIFSLYGPRSGNHIFEATAKYISRV